jgi:hypothetical protein
MIRLQCPKCETKLGVDDSKAGGVAVCPDCGQKFRIPGKPAASASKPNPAKATPPPKKQAVPAKQAAAKPAAPPSRPKEPWEEEDSSPYTVREIEEAGDDALKVEYGVDKDYEKKVERKRLEEEKKEFQQFIGLILILVVVGGVVNVLFLIDDILVYVPVGLGLLVFLAGTGMLMAQGFAKDVLQALLVIVPGYDIFFAVTRFKDARNALMMKYLGAIICGAGLLLGGYGKIKGLIDKARDSSALLKTPVFVMTAPAKSSRL